MLLEAAIHDEGDGLILCDKVMTVLILVTLFFFFWTELTLWLPSKCNLMDILLSKLSK